MKVTLRCTHEQYHGLSKACGDARDGSVVVKVDKKALEALIADHGNLVRLHRGELEGHL